MRITAKALRPVFMLLLLAGAYAGGWWHRSHIHSNPESEKRSRHAAGLSHQGIGPGRGEHRLATHPDGPGGAEKPKLSGADRLTKLLDGGQSDSREAAGALTEWARVDGAAAWAAFLADARLQNSECAHQLMAVLAGADPAGTMARLEQLPRKPWASQAVKSAARAWAEKDGPAATAAGLALPPGARRRDFLSAAFRAWTGKDMGAAALWLKSLPPEESIPAIFGTEHFFLGGAKSAGEMNAIVEIHRLGPGSQKVWMEHDYMHWTHKEPEVSFQWALQSPADLPRRKEIIEHAMSAMARDHERGLRVLPTLTDPAQRNQLQQAIATSWAAKDPEAAWEWVMSSSAPEIRSKALDSIASTWAGTDPEKAVPFLQQHLPDGLGTWGPSAARAWGRDDPDASIAWVAALSSEQRGKIVSAALDGIREQQPAKAMEHADLISAGSERTNFLRNTAQSLAEQDVTLASTRIAALSPGPDRDAAISGLFQPAFDVEPDSAMVWAASIGDPHSRSNTLNNGFDRWLKADAAAAEEWLSRSGLDDAARIELQRMANEARAAQEER